MPAGMKSETKKFLLFGEGRVPEIIIIQPKKYDEYKNLFHLTFSPTLNDKASNKLISFQNSGDFPCKVILEIFEDPKHFFCLEPEENTIPMLNCPGKKKRRKTNTCYFSFVFIP